MIQSKLSHEYRQKNRPQPIVKYGNHNEKTEIEWLVFLFDP